MTVRVVVRLSVAGWLRRLANRIDPPPIPAPQPTPYVNVWGSTYWSRPPTEPGYGTSVTYNGPDWPRAS